MKTTLSFIVMLFLASPFLKAQDVPTEVPSEAKDMAAQTQDLGEMINQVAEGIKPEAFTDEFTENKEEWIEEASSLDQSDMSAVSEQLTGLVNGLKDEAFTAGTKDNLMSSLSNLGSVSDVGNVLTSMVRGLNPSMITDAFANNKDTLMKGLEMLSN